MLELLLPLPRESWGRTEGDWLYVCLMSPKFSFLGPSPGISGNPLAGPRRKEFSSSTQCLTSFPRILPMLMKLFATFCRWPEADMWLWAACEGTVSSSTVSEIW
jgi:hypothetical protein